jgi:hypothetical protein
LHRARKSVALVLSALTLALAAPAMAPAGPQRAAHRISLGPMTSSPSGSAPRSGAAAPRQRPVSAVDQNAVEGTTRSMERVLPYEFRGDVRDLPQFPLGRAISQRPYIPDFHPPKPTKFTTLAAGAPPGILPANIPLAPMPSPLQNFAGLSLSDSCAGGQCGGGWPPDTNGDVGLNHYILAVNDAYAIYSKTGALLAAFTENQLWSGAGPNPCNGDSGGDPVVLYDQLADRWILTHFAFAFSGLDPVSPFYECIAVSKTSDPVAGGWWLYPLRMDPGGTGLPPVDSINDYPKFGIWPDCLYMASNEFDIPSNAFVGTAYASFSRSDLENGSALTWSLGFLNNTSDPFTMIPSNLRGTSAGAVPPSGTPNYFVSQSQIGFAFEVRKFAAGANCGAGGSLGFPANVSQTIYTAFPEIVVPQPNTANLLDVVDDRLMQKVQYRRVANAESLWVVHSVQNVGGTVRPQWAQIDVTGGAIAAAPVQQQIYAPDTTLYRWMGSIAADSQGNIALGYSTSNGTSPNFPSIAYSGRLATDPPSSLSQTETQLIAGAGSQTNSCGSAPCHRWGDYTAMSVDPVDDCTFWYTNQYYSSGATGAVGDWQTRIGSFSFPSCTGTVALNPNGVPFNTQVVGTTSATTDVQLANSGSSTLNVTSISLTGASAGDFVLAAPASGSPACSFAASGINAGSSCFFGVQFKPAATGARSASVSVADDASTSPQKVALVGTALTTVTLNPTSVPFNTQLVGTTSATTDVQLTNSGSSTINVTSITLTGTSPGDFVLAAPASGSPACSFAASSINAGSSCFFGVRFKPTATGARSASVSVADDAPDSPQAIALTGTGMVVPAVSLSAASFAFGNVNVGDSAAASPPITLTNSGNGPLTITSFTLTGTDAGQYTQTNTCPVSPATLAAGANCTVTPKSQPISTGAKNDASLSIFDDAPGSPHTIALTSSGVDFALAGPTAAVTVAAGQPANFTMNLTTIGAPTLNAVAFTATGNPAATTVSFNPQSIPAGSVTGSTMLTVTTTARGAAPPMPAHPVVLPPVLLWLVIAASALTILVALRRTMRKPRLAYYLPLALLLISTALATGCGGGGGSGVPQGTPAGTSTITVSATSGSAGNVNRAIQVTLTVQ